MKPIIEEEAMYSIGDKIWYAHFNSTVEQIICPECQGKLFITVILGDDSRVTIPCAGCARGYEPPRGTVDFHTHEAKPKQVTISRVEIHADKVEYGFDGCYIADPLDLFVTESDAQSRAEEKAAKWTAEQNARVWQKERQSHTWAWHVHYHRKCIRDMEKQLEYHRAALDAAKLKSKAA